MTNNDIRNYFPALARKVYGRNLVYFDNAATTQRSISVLSKWQQMAGQSNANIHRAVHCLATEATDAYETARDSIQQFINAANRREIIFTSGATMSLNLLAYSFSERYLNEGDEVIVSQAEHHSNIVPWQLACIRKKAKLKVLPIDERGELRMDLLPSLITDKTRIVSVTYVSNVLGIVNPVRELVSLCHSRSVPVAVDASQAVVHLPVDVQDLDCDFLVFSGHKMYAATGTGVLYGKEKWLQELPPFLSGGEMVGTVSFEETTFASLPMKFEAGTQNFNAVPTFIDAVDTVKALRVNELKLNIIKEYLFSSLKAFEGLTLYGDPRSIEDKIPLFSFCIKGVHHEDLALILDKMGIAARSGQMCAEPLVTSFGQTGMLRISLLPYNTLEEAQYFMASLQKAVKMLQ